MTKDRLRQLHEKYTSPSTKLIEALDGSIGRMFSISKSLRKAWVVLGYLLLGKLTQPSWK